jgi:nucleolar protein 15
VPTNRSKKLAKKAARAAQNNISTPSTPGTIYLGHIPHGFFEKQMHAYFSQFGTISRLRLSRNRRTGKSKHYGWVEFGSKEVAEIVAETMDGYLIHPQRLVCKVVEVDERVWKGANKVFKRVPWQRLAREELEGKRTREKWTELETRDDERRRERNEKIKEAGIEYEFPLRGEKRKAPQEEEEDKQGEETKKAKPKKGTGEKSKPEKSGKEKRVVSGSKNKAKK